MFFGKLRINECLAFVSVVCKMKGSLKSVLEGGGKEMQTA